MSLVWSKQESTAQTSSGRLDRNRSAGTAETPIARVLLAPMGDLQALIAADALDALVVDTEDLGAMTCSRPGMVRAVDEHGGGAGELELPSALHGLNAFAVVGYVGRAQVAEHGADPLFSHSPAGESVEIANDCVVRKGPQARAGLDPGRLAQGRVTVFLAERYERLNSSTGMVRMPAVCWA